MDAAARAMLTAAMGKALELMTEAAAATDFSAAGRHHKDVETLRQLSSTDNIPAATEDWLP